jgi:cold shock CspA family protein
MTGIMISWNTKKGFGFVAPLAGPQTGEVEPVFVHVSSILGRAHGEFGGLPAGAEVSFDLVRKDKGSVQACNVRPKVLGGNSLHRATIDSGTQAPGSSHFNSRTEPGNHSTALEADE